jgi:predicted metal-dependent phosphoesterase TrpH
LKIDCHCHTVYSKHWFWGFDALNTPDEMIRAAVKRGLDGLAVVDHNNVRGSLIARQVAKRYRFTILTGTEIKTATGDLIGLGLTEDIPMRLSVEETVEMIHDKGGIAVAPHPFSNVFFRECIGVEASKADAVEVFNATLSRMSNNKALMLSKKFKLGRTAGSDAHSINDVGNAGIYCDGDPLEEIAKNRAKIFGTKTCLRNTALYVARKFIRSAEWRLDKKKKLMSQKYLSSSLIP